MEKHIITALVEDRPGVLNRIASLFRRRGFNIQSLAVGSSEQPGLSRMTIVVGGDSQVVEQVRKQLDKLIEVVRVSDLSSGSFISREFMLIKVKANSQTRGEIIQLTEIFRGNVVDVASDSLIIEITGDEEKVGSLIGLLHRFGIKEIAQTGCLAMTRGERSKDGKHPL